MPELKDGVGTNIRISGNQLFIDGAPSENASDILTAIKTVDGAGSGLDADTVDGVHAADFAPIAHVGAGGSAHAVATTSVAGFLSASDKTKLDGVAAGAEVNVNADWNATSGDAQILNKPTLGTAAAEDVGYFATAAQGSLADSAVQPGDDAATLGSGGADAEYVLTADGSGGVDWLPVARELNDLSDVLIALPSNNDILIYNESGGTWENVAGELFSSGSLFDGTYFASAEDVALHIAETTTAHGGIVADDDPRLSDSRDPNVHGNEAHAAEFLDAYGVEGVIDVYVTNAFVEGLAVDATSLSSGAAAAGEVLTADGSGGSFWDTPTPPPSALDDLSDVDATSPTDGHVLTWDAGVNAWVDAAPSGGATALDELTDVNAPTPSDGYVLTWSASSNAWVDAPGAATPLALDDLTDVSAAAPTDGQVLKWSDASNAWVAAADAGGGTVVASGAYDLELGFVGSPTANQQDFIVLGRGVTISAADPGVAYARVLPEYPWIAEILVNDYPVGNVEIDELGIITWGVSADIVLVSGDVLALVAPSVADSLIEDVRVVLLGGSGGGGGVADPNDANLIIAVQVFS